MSQARASGWSPWDLVLAGCLVVVLGATVAAVAGLGPAALDERARRLDAELRCPVCQGTSIADSPAPLAAQMRQVVRERLADGATEADVRAYFVERYGVWILLAPDPAGPGLLLWLAPGLALVGGSVLIVAYRRRRRSPGPSGEMQRRRLSGPVIVGSVALILLSVAAPLAVAIGPRVGGAQISGRTPVIQGAPSVEELEWRVTLDPRDVGSLTSLGDAYLDAGRAGDAADAYRRVLEIEPDNGAALVGSAAVLIGAGRPDVALPLLDRAVARRDTADARLYRALARYQLEGRLTADVRADARRFLELAPLDPRTELVKGLLVAEVPSPSP